MNPTLIKHKYLFTSFYSKRQIQETNTYCILQLLLTLLFKDTFMCFSLEKTVGNQTVKTMIKTFPSHGIHENEGWVRWQRIWTTHLKEIIPHWGNFPPSMHRWANILWLQMGLGLQVMLKVAYKLPVGARGQVQCVLHSLSLIHRLPLVFHVLKGALGNS